MIVCPCRFRLWILIFQTQQRVTGCTAWYVHFETLVFFCYVIFSPYGFNDDTLDCRGLLLVTSRSLFAGFQIPLLMVYHYIITIFLCQLLSLVPFLLWIQYSFDFYVYLEWHKHKYFLFHRSMLKKFPCISMLNTYFPALFSLQKWHMQMFLQLHMSFLMDSKLYFSHIYFQLNEYLYCLVSLVHPCQGWSLPWGLIWRTSTLSASGAWASHI